MAGSSATAAHSSWRLRAAHIAGGAGYDGHFVYSRIKRQGMTVAWPG